MIHLPQELTQAEATALASPQDTQAMRVIVRRVANQAPYRLHGKRKSYVLTYCERMRAHHIDVPFSVWAWGIDPARPYEDNDSVAHDVQSNFAHAESLILLPVPFANPRAEPVGDFDRPPPPPEVLASLRSLAARFGAPPVILDAFDLAGGDDPAAICLALDHTFPGPAGPPDRLPGPEDDGPPPASPQDRARKGRKDKPDGLM